MQPPPAKLTEAAAALPSIPAAVETAIGTPILVKPPSRSVLFVTHLLALLRLCNFRQLQSD